MYIDKDKQNLRMKGIIVPVDWDEGGNILALAISTYEEDEYLIEGAYWEQKLKKLLHEAVEVHGSYFERHGRKRILVSKCIIQAMPDETGGGDLYQEGERV